MLVLKVILSELSFVAYHMKMEVQLFKFIIVYNIQTLTLANIAKKRILKFVQLN
jgi:hypothetical protein